MPAIEAETGLRRGRLDALLKTLRVDGAVDRVGSGWVGDRRAVGVRRGEVRPGRRRAPGRGRPDAGATRTAARCLMQVLTEALDDPSAGPCGRCSVCTGELPAPGARPDPERVLAARRHLRGRRHVLEPRKLWPSGLAGRRGRIVGLAPGPGGRVRRRPGLARPHRRAGRPGRRALRRAARGAGATCCPGGPGSGTSGRSRCIAGAEPVPPVRVARDGRARRRGRPAAPGGRARRPAGRRRRPRWPPGSGSRELFAGLALRPARCSAGPVLLVDDAAALDLDDHRVRGPAARRRLRPRPAARRPPPPLTP